MINRDNYEAYLLDLLEGRLSADEEQELREFLRMHPDCSAALESLEPWILEKSTVSFPRRELLKKVMPGPATRISEHSFDLVSIARMEGDLTPEQEREHEALLAGNEQLRKDWQTWQHARLIPDPVIFQHKSGLKRNTGTDRRFFWITVAAAAAAVALLLILFIPGPSLTEYELAGTAPDPEPVTSGEIPAGIETEAIIEVPPPLRITGREAPPAVRQESGGEADETGVQGTLEMGSDTAGVQRTADPGRVGPSPLRIAANLQAFHSAVVPGTYDRISPLEMAPIPVHLSSLSISQLRELDLQTLFDDYTQENDISLWTIVNAGFKGINRLTGSEMSLMAYRDDQGEVLGFRFSSRRFSWTRPLDRSE